MNTAQPIAFSNNFTDQAKTFIEDSKKKSVAPTLKGFAQLIGVSEETLLSWANKKKKDPQGNLTEELARPKFNAVIKTIQKLSAEQSPDPKADKKKPAKIKDGRPAKFKSVDELQEKIDKYFESCWSQKLDMFGNPIFVKDEKGKKTDEKVMVQTRPYTITGLAVALDTSRETLINYEKNEDFFDTIKRAKERCHSYAEESLFIGKNPSGAIFNLKNNYGWEDKSAVDHTTKGEKLPNPIMGGGSNVPVNDSD